MEINYDKLVKEWSNRMSGREPIYTNRYHKSVLREVMKDFGYPLELLGEEATNTIINSLASKKIVLDDKFYSWLEENLSDDDFVTEARIFQSKYTAGDAFQITSDAGLSTFDGQPILNYDEESGDFKDSGKKFNASQLFIKQSDTDIKKSSVNYVKIGQGGTQVTLKGDDGVTYVIDAAKSNLSKFAKAKPADAINWMDASLETAQGLGLYLKKDYAYHQLQI